MAIKAIQTEEPEVRFYNLTSIADRFREDGIRNKILVEAVKYLEFVPRNKQFGAAFVLASNYKLLTPAGETDVIPAREEGLKAAFGAIKHLPKTKRAEAARELFEAATDLPDLRAAIVKRHGKSLPNGGQPMSVADFLNAKIG